MTTRSRSTEQIEPTARSSKSVPKTIEDPKKRRPEIAPPGEIGENVPQPVEIDVPDAPADPEADIPTRPEIEIPDPGGVPDRNDEPESPAPTEPFPP